MPIQPIQTPDWVKNAVFYQIFPDRFARTQRQVNDPAMAVPLEAWDSPPTSFGYKGGSLWGVLDQLDYLQDLGINAIYFTPIFQSASNHRYHTHDYYRIDPLLGGDTAFYQLLQAAHERQMRVVLDGVFNHSSRGFFYFNDVLENGPHSPWLDWFKVSNWPLAAYDGERPANYTGWVGNRALPTFNHDNPHVREYIMRVAEFWVKQGIDGWRLDVPFEITADGFWQEFRDRVKAINPEAYIIGEVWHDARAWLDGSQFDGVMNYLFTGPTLAFTAKERVVRSLVEAPNYHPYPALDAAGYAAKIEALLGLYDWEIQQSQLNILSSHDTARALSVASDDKDSVALAVLLQMTFPGAPSLYYGDEVGLGGGLDPDCRRVFPEPAAWDQSLLSLHKQLIALRHAHPALRTGRYRCLLVEGEVYGLSRSLPAETLTVVVNSGDRAAEPRLVLPAAEHLSCLFSHNAADFRAEAGTVQLKLPPRSGIILSHTA